MKTSLILGSLFFSGLTLACPILEGNWAPSNMNYPDARVRCTLDQTEISLGNCSGPNKIRLYAMGTSSNRFSGSSNLMECNSTITVDGQDQFRIRFNQGGSVLYQFLY